MSFECPVLSFAETYKNILDISYLLHLQHLQYKKVLYLTVLFIPDHLKLCENSF